MPANDGTGPSGMGPRTGRGLGRCNQSNLPINFSRSNPIRNGFNQSRYSWRNVLGRLLRGRNRFQ